MYHPLHRTFLVAAACLWAGLVGCQSETKRAAPGALPTGPARPEVAPRLSASTYFAHAHLLERQGNLEQAVKQYRAALELSPDFVSAHNRLGITLNKLGQHAEASNEFRTAIERAPAEAHLYNNLGFSLYLEGIYDQAGEAYLRALQLNRDYPRARMNYGILLAQQGEYDAAFDELSVATNAADAHYNLGVIQTERGDYALAVRSLETALSLNPKLEDARQQLHAVARRVAEIPGPLEPPPPPPSADIASPEGGEQTTTATELARVPESYEATNAEGDVTTEDAAVNPAERSGRSRTGGPKTAKPPGARRTSRADTTPADDVVILAADAGSPDSPASPSFRMIQLDGAERRFEQAEFVGPPSAETWPRTWPPLIDPGWV